MGNVGVFIANVGFLMVNVGSYLWRYPWAKRLPITNGERSSGFVRHPMASKEIVE